MSTCVHGMEPVFLVPTAPAPATAVVDADEMWPQLAAALGSVVLVLVLNAVNLAFVPSQ